jgi:hypothetical protein
MRKGANMEESSDQTRRIVANNRWRSKTGWIFVAIYLVAAFFLFRDALTCGGMLCDLPAIFVFLPAGEVYYVVSNFLFGYDPGPFREWRFIIPSVLTNVVLYYFLGRLMGWLTMRFLIRKGSR